MSLVGSLKPCAMLTVKDRAVAKGFYGGTLGLSLQSEDEYGLVYAMNGASLRITPMGDFTPRAHTVLGWNVDDVAATVRALTAAGIVFERYHFLAQDELGIWSSDGAHVAWFKDPDGNVLSLSDA